MLFPIICRSSLYPSRVKEPCLKYFLSQKNIPHKNCRHIFGCNNYIDILHHMGLAKKRWPEISSGSWSHRWPERLRGVKSQNDMSKYWLHHHFSEPHVCKRLASRQALKSNGCGTILDISILIMNPTLPNHQHIVCMYTYLYRGHIL